MAVGLKVTSANALRASYAEPDTDVLHCQEPSDQLWLCLKNPIRNSETEAISSAMVIGSTRELHPQRSPERGT